MLFWKWLSRPHKICVSITLEDSTKRATQIQLHSLYFLYIISGLSLPEAWQSGIFFRLLADVAAVLVNTTWESSSSWKSGRSSRSYSSGKSGKWKSSGRGSYRRSGEDDSWWSSNPLRGAHAEWKNEINYSYHTSTLLVYPQIRNWEYNTINCTILSCRLVVVL